MVVVKNRLQAAPDTRPPLYANTRDCIKKIFKADGISGFFVGFTPCVLRAVPANAAAFTAFETAMKVLPERI
jgi:solute carrier family 25 carnitine/acylcarnitine transporter 20/29